MSKYLDNYLTKRTKKIMKLSLPKSIVLLVLGILAWFSVFQLFHSLADSNPAYEATRGLLYFVAIFCVSWFLVSPGVIGIGQHLIYRSSKVKPLDLGTRLMLEDQFEWAKLGGSSKRYEDKPLESDFIRKPKKKRLNFLRK